MTSKTKETKSAVPIRQMSGEEWLRICRQLEPYHGVFYKLWSMGKPIFTNDVPTAAVEFAKGGDYVWFHFNPDFWDSMDEYERLFVICHEALHVILNHGMRMRDAESPEDCNIAMDIVVNHLLTRSFGFERDKIRGWGNLCWVDTVFKGKNGKLKQVPDLKDRHERRDMPLDESFEYYYNWLEPRNVKMFILIGVPIGDKAKKAGSKGGTLDDHSKLGKTDCEEVIRKLRGQMSDDELDRLADAVRKHIEGDGDLDNEESDKQAGTGTGGCWHFVPKAQRVKKKKKWETVIKKWSKKYLVDHSHDHEQWARLNRRMIALPRETFLPSEMEVDEVEKDKHRIGVYFFLDTSGSCWNLKDRFFNAARTLPKERFDIRLFCFDTKVVETTLVSGRIYGGGGTRFDIIETHIQMCMASGANGGKYPDAVFLITDGYGTPVCPQIPERWYWFLDLLGSSIYSVRLQRTASARRYVPEKSHWFLLEDFE